MTQVNSTNPRARRKGQKPEKPSKDFPLFPHSNGQWAKKVKGHMHFFGVWADHEKALETWLKDKDALLAGMPRPSRSSPGAQHSGTMRDLVNSFLTAKRRLVDSGELSEHTWRSYDAVCAELIQAFGRQRSIATLTPNDFDSLRASWASRWGLVRLGAEITRARTVFIFAWKNHLIELPVRFGDGFRGPSKKSIRIERAAKGPVMFTAAELRSMIDGATQPIKAMLLLAINAGLGNNDVAQLPLYPASKNVPAAIDFEGAWLHYPRPKTGIMRRCPLWPETMAALQEWLELRPEPKTEAVANLLFLTVRGDGWASNLKDRAITHETRKLLDKLKITGKRNFYAIRHTFETIGGNSRDQVAVDAIMGHDNGSMANVYREKIEDERLVEVTDYVREWLFHKEEGARPAISIYREPEAAREPAEIA